MATSVRLVAMALVLHKRVRAFYPARSSKAGYPCPGGSRCLQGVENESSNLFFYATSHLLIGKRVGTKEEMLYLLNMSEKMLTPKMPGLMSHRGLNGFVMNTWRQQKPCRI
jgi:hypothetical protein